MKNDLTELFFHMEQASPEAMRAQRMAELKNLAEWRQRYVQQVIEWSDPVKREERKNQYAKDEVAGRTKLPGIPAEQVKVRTGESKLSILPGIPMQLSRLTWFERVRRFLINLWRAL